VGVEKDKIFFCDGNNAFFTMGMFDNVIPTFRFLPTYLRKKHQ
jgi:hypothetical protein